MPTLWDHTLAGGHPVLDFVNTVDDWTATASEDYLSTFEDAARFAETVGLLNHREALQLAPGARGSNRAPAELRSLRQLRASLERILRASLAGRAASAADLEALRRNFTEAARRTELVAGAGGQLARRIRVESNGPAALRLRIVDAALPLVLSDSMHRVKACPTCGWFFLDVSKNQSRVWCSMDTCGARAKARRYYQRTKRARRPQ